MKIQIGQDEKGNPIYDEVENVNFKPVKEEWNEYELEDGTTLRMRLVVGKVLRSENRRTPAGEPIYNVRHQNVIMTDVPDELIEKPE